MTDLPFLLLTKVLLIKKGLQIVSSHHFSLSLLLRGSPGNIVLDVDHVEDVEDVDHVDHDDHVDMLDLLVAPHSADLA